MTSTERPKRLRTRQQRAFVATLIATGLVTFAFRNPWFRGNFGVVEVGRVYRSAQPLDGLPRLIAEKRIKTVLNLRGGSDADPWYSAEVAATQRLGVNFYDLPLKATVRPSRTQLLTVLDLLDRCQYPLLIHCKSGSDRTGLVSGLYLMSRTGEDPQRRERRVLSVLRTRPTPRHPTPPRTLPRIRRLAQISEVGPHSPKASRLGGLRIPGRRRPGRTRPSAHRPTTPKVGRIETGNNYK